ncbi:baseplate protein [Xanthomonas phage SB3]|uniref:Baseplate protein n=1 Tax=Xanthomonas phage SB3 TaxID=3117472 RepID=A0ABZ2GVP5_9CAUD
MIKMPRASAKGFYRVEVLRPDGSVKSDTGEFPNLITTIGGTRLLQDFGRFAGRCFAGTGTAPPQVTDSQLVNEVMFSGQGVDSHARNASTKPFYHQSQWVFTFGAATANQTIGEIGVGDNYSPYTLSSRALPRDTAGNVTTISVLVGEILRVTYVLRMYFDMTKYEGSFEANGVTYNYVAMATQMDDSSFWNLRVGYSLRPDSSGTGFYQHPADTKFVDEGLISQRLDKGVESGQSYNYNPSEGTITGSKYTFKVIGALAFANFTKGINVIRIGHSTGNYRSGPSYTILLDKYMPKTADMSLEFVFDLDYAINVP